MRATIVGAGSVGLLLGARLREAGCEVGFVVRRRAAALALAADGVGVRDLASGALRDVAVEACVGLEAARAWLPCGPVFLTTRAPDLQVVADALARVEPDPLVVCAANDIGNEALLAERFRRVVGLVVRQTSTRSGDREVATLGHGRLVLGAFAGPVEEPMHALAERLRAACYDVGLSPDITGDKWLKLCVNLMSTPNALVRREDHASETFVETKVRLLEEARDVLRKAAIAARSGDGRDRDLDAEIAFQRATLARGESARSLPLYNAVWTALRHGAPLEADRYHERIIALGAAQGVPTPINQKALQLLQQAVQDKKGPESHPAEAFLQHPEKSR